MSASTRLSLPYLAPSQSQKHVTVNESLRKLDAIVHLTVQSAATAAEPASPADGDIYILPGGKTGAAWGAMTDLALAYHVDGAWSQITPREGWLAFVQDTDELFYYTGASWSHFPVAKLLKFSATDKLAGRSSSGAGAAEEIACTAAARALLDDADAHEQCKTLGCWKVLGAGATAVSHTGNTSETALATIAIPANAMGANGVIRVTAIFSYTNSANNKTMKFRFGASGVGGTSIMSAVMTTTATVMHQRTIHNRNATNAQVSGASGNTSTFGGSSTALGTAATDTTAAQNIVITGQLANSGETITLEAFLVEVFHAA